MLHPSAVPRYCHRSRISRPRKEPRHPSGCRGFLSRRTGRAQSRWSRTLDEEIRITGVAHLPHVPGDPITSQLLRELPTARIEVAINKLLFAMSRTTTLTGKIELPSGRKVAERDVVKPLGDPKQTSDFYELVALQHGRLSANGDPNPSATMAELNGVALGTAQGWDPKARARGHRPPNSGSALR